MIDDDDDEVDDRRDEEGWCECGAYHCEEDIDWNVCSCCGGKLE